MAETASQIVPPYLPYKTFVSSFARLADGIPPKIDRQVWKNQTGSIQSQIFAAYRFFELLSPEGIPTKRLEQLVNAGDDFAKEFAPIFRQHYVEILKHPLSTMTQRMLSEEFDAAFGAEGETKKKAIRFFLQAAKESGLTLSRFLLDQTRAPAAPRRKKASKREAEPRTQDELQSADEQPLPAGRTYRTIRLRSGGELALSMSVDLFDLTGRDREFVFGLIDSFKKYEGEASYPAAKEGDRIMKLHS
jgi:hypothetical protein